MNNDNKDINFNQLVNSIKNNDKNPQLFHNNDALNKGGNVSNNNVMSYNNFNTMNGNQVNSLTNVVNNSYAASNQVNPSYNNINNNQINSTINVSNSQNNTNLSSNVNTINTNQVNPTTNVVNNGYADSNQVNSSYNNTNNNQINSTINVSNSQNNTNLSNNVNTINTNQVNSTTNVVNNGYAGSNQANLTNVGCNQGNIGVIDSKGIDSNDNYKKNKFNIFQFLTNQRILLWLTIFIFIFTSVTVGKTFYLRNKVDEYENFFIEIEEKESVEVVVYDDLESLGDSLKNIAASEYIECINSSIDIDNIPDSIKSIMAEINNYYNSSNNYLSFKYKDIYTGFSVSYNENQKIYTASTIKAPKDIYLYEMASMGKINLDEKLTYTSKYYNDGSGTLKNNKFNTKYDVRTLLKYSTVYSDNAAHNMLMDKYGRKNMLEFWKEKGTDAIFTKNNNWGVTSAHDASIYMEELYRFYIEEEKYGKELMNNFLSANPKFIKGKNNYKVANKSGWAGTAIHDVSIIFADNPYIVVTLSNLGEKDYYMSYFNKVNDLSYKLHTEYWKYKMDICGNINQY